MPTCCPAPTYLASVATSLTGCKLELDQILRFAFWRTGNKFATITGISTQASWTTFLTATGTTKIVVTPILENVVFEGGAVREVGSGNEVPYGIPYVKGREPIKVTGEITGSAQSVIVNLKKLQCENLDVFAINNHNQVTYKSDTDGYGFRIYGFACSDLIPGGLIGKDVNKFQFFMEPNYSDKLVQTTATTFALSMVNT